MTTVALLADNWNEGLPAECNQASQDLDWWQALRIVREASRSTGKAVLIAFKTLDRMVHFVERLERGKDCAFDHRPNVLLKLRTGREVESACPLTVRFKFGGCAYTSPTPKMG
jgi:hypothetical protein